MSGTKSSVYTLRKPYPLINTKKKFIVFTNAKCGGTTIKVWFLDSLNLKKSFANTYQALTNFGFVFVFKWYKYQFFNHDIEQIKASNAYLRKFIKIYRRRTLSKIKLHINNPEYYKIAVVRNPYDRLVSGFVDKFCGEDLNKSWVQNVINEVNKNPDALKNQITFKQFIDYLYNNDLKNVDAHWRNQYHVLEGAKLDEIIHLKDITKKLPELSKKLGFKTTVNLNTKKQSNTYAKGNGLKQLPDVYNIPNTDLIIFKKTHGYFPNKSSFYNNELKQKVKTIYQADFNAFNFA